MDARRPLRLPKGHVLVVGLLTPVLQAWQQSTHIGRLTALGRGLTGVGEGAAVVVAGEAGLVLVCPIGHAPVAAGWGALGRDGSLALVGPELAGRGAAGERRRLGGGRVEPGGEAVVEGGLLAHLEGDGGAGGGHEPGGRLLLHAHERVPVDLEELVPGLQPPVPLRRRAPHHLLHVDSGLALSHALHPQPASACESTYAGRNRQWNFVIQTMATITTKSQIKLATPA